LINKSAAQLLRQQLLEAHPVQRIADDFANFLDTFHSYREPYDDHLDAWLHELYAFAKRNQPRLDYRGVYFSPSSANSCKRELYVKALKMPRDQEDVKPWQRRWTAQGTAIGDWLQREILLAERHYERFTGEPPKFRMARTATGAPFFEDFVKTQRFFEYDGAKFSILGTCDGVLEYTSDDGEVIRVGLEIKSKQTSYSETSKLQKPKEDHVKQVTCYSLMYDVDYYLIVYINTSKKAWNMTDDEFAKSPDFKVFGIEITDEMKHEVLQTFAEVTNAVENNEPPALDLDKWTFNNFKTSCALSLTEAEFTELEAKVKRVLKSRLPDWKKQQYYDALEFIKKVREGVSV
jgi:CRISPR/Cas system-associated exonuclease Cas4 (RecB family)